MGDFLAAISSWDHGIWSFIANVWGAFWSGMPSNPTGFLGLVKKVSDLLSFIAFSWISWTILGKKLIYQNFVEFKNGVFTFGDDDRKNLVGYIVAASLLMTNWIQAGIGAGLVYFFKS